MTTVNSSTSSLSALSAKTGIGGLASGMDIDQLVENLTATSRQKILKQKQNIQRLEWKQTAYRSVSTILKEFQKSYLDILSPTNIRNASFFNTVKATSDSSAIAVSSASSASAGSITINSISQLATNQTVSSNFRVSKPLSGTLTGTGPADLVTSISGKSISLNLDGRVKILSFNAEFTADFQAGLLANPENPAIGLEEAFQNLLDKSFGSSIVDASIQNGQLSFSAPGSRLTIGAVGDDTTVLTKLGFASGQSNKLVLNESLKNLSLNSEYFQPSVSTYKFTINSVPFEFSSSDSLLSVISKINASDAGVTLSYSAITDNFTMTAKNSGTGENIIIEENPAYGSLMSAFGLTGSGSTNTYGLNSILTVNDNEIVRSSNRVEIDGVNIDLLAESTEPIKITKKEDATSLFETIKKMVADYNNMADLINKLTKEKIYSDFPPLSDEQRNEMSESEVKAWEEKSKSGILRGDSLLRNIAAKLHDVVISTKAQGTSLYTLGITSAGYTENGKLKIDEEKLKKALETKGFEIGELFSSVDGLGNKINDIIQVAIKTSGTQGSRGTLVEMAGVASTRSDTENYIYEQKERTNKAISKLQTRLTNEEKRYWRQFTAMETALQQLNAQSAILSQFSAK